MRETESALSPSHETLDTEPEPQPVTTDDDLLKSVERAQMLWTTLADAQVRRADGEVTQTIEEIAAEYETLAILLNNTPATLTPIILETAREELSYVDVLEKMRYRSNRTPRIHAPAVLGTSHDFVL